MDNRTTTAISVIAALAIGTLVGAGIALLVAPQAGKKTRKLLQKKGMELMDMAASSASDTRDKAAKTIGDVTNQAKGMNPFMRSRSKKMKNFISDQACRVEARMH